MCKQLFDGKKGESNNVLVLLVAVSMVVIVIGTWAVMNSIDSASDNARLGQKSVDLDSGTIVLTVGEPDQVRMSSVGMVTLNILPE